jgi:transposase-like protein
MACSVLHSWRQESQYKGKGRFPSIRGRITVGQKEIALLKKPLKVISVEHGILKAAVGFFDTLGSILNSSILEIEV